MEHVSIETVPEKFPELNMRIHFKIFNKMLAQYYTANELHFGGLFSIVKWIFGVLYSIHNRIMFETCIWALAQWFNFNRSVWCVVQKVRRRQRYSMAATLLCGYKIQKHHVQSGWLLSRQFQI